MACFLKQKTTQKQTRTFKFNVVKKSDDPTDLLDEMVNFTAEFKMFTACYKE